MAQWTITHYNPITIAANVHDLIGHLHLASLEARAEIEGGPEKYVKSGSTLKLMCHIRQNSVAPDFVFWYHDGRMINYEGALGVTVLGDAASSTLIIGKAQSLHSGNYSCVPSNVRPASVIVHILNGNIKLESIPILAFIAIRVKCHYNLLLHKL